jgi:predicted transcriptional regulator
VYIPILDIISGMKVNEQSLAKQLRKQGMSIGAISLELGVAKSSVSLWIRDIKITGSQSAHLKGLPFTSEAVEKRRISRLSNEKAKRSKVIELAQKEIVGINDRELWLMGVMLYWAEGGKTQRMVRFSNGDPKMIKIMMLFFRKICLVSEDKFRGYIHIHSHLDHRKAGMYWAEIANIPKEKFLKHIVRKKGLIIPEKTPCHTE